MPCMLHFTPVALSLFPLLVHSAPWHAGADLPRLQDDLFITKTLMSTRIETLTTTTFTTVTFTSTGGSDAATLVLSPSGASHVSAREAVLVLPPDALPTATVSPPSAIPSSQPTPPPLNTTVGSIQRPQMMAYYPDWAAPAFPPEEIDFDRFDWIDYAFAVPDETFNLTWDGSDDAPNLLTRLVSAAHGKGKNVKLSVGGWSGSKFFSPAVSNPQNRQTFVANILALYEQFDLDGIDIDWEYPGQDGNAGNHVSPNDTANFLTFLQLLRATLPPSAKITAATQTVPFADDAGNPLADASAFAQVLDWVLLMNYDAWGSSSSPGPNAPLSDGCYNATQDSANAFSAIQAWTAAGFPASKLVLGVPSYGYISRSSATVLRSRSHASPRTRRSRHARRHLSLMQWTDALVPASGPLLPPPVLATSEDGGTDSGQVQFSELVRQGVLQSTPGAARAVVQGTELRSLYAGWSGFTRYWDACSSTPYLRSAAAGQVVTYDDPMSLGMKAVFAREAGMRGVNMFDVHGDTEEWDLTDALRRGLGVDLAY